MKQIINLPGYSIEINEHEGVIVTTVNSNTIGKPLAYKSMTFGDYSTLKSNFLNRNKCTAAFDPAEYGVYIALSGGLYITPERFNKNRHETPIGVLLKTKHASIIISKEDLPEMTWDEAIKHNPFDRHEAIEIHNNKEQIDKALKLIGGQPIKDEWYWTRDEYSTIGAWAYYGTYGTLTIYLKNYSYSVRPVTAF